MQAPPFLLSAELERESQRAIYRTYDALNAELFGRALARPGIELSCESSHLGRWLGEARRIELQKSLLVEHGWGTLVEVLKHEMAHQYCDEILGAPDETSHGSVFRRVCAERGIDSRAAGVPLGTPESAGAAAPILERIAKLLSLAQSSNEHEAQAAMSAAQRLMLKYNIDAALEGDGTRYSFRHLGKPSGRIAESERVLASILREHFFVETIWASVWRPLEAKEGRVLEVCGTPQNLELAEYVHSFLTHTAEQLWRDHARRDHIRGRAERRRFVSGVMAGFKERLDRERRGLKAEGLVWVGDALLGEFFRARHRNVRWMYYRGAERSSSYVSGKEAGRNVVLHRGVKQGPGGEAQRLLPSGKQ